MLKRLELEKHWIAATLVSLAIGIGAIVAFLSGLAAIWTVMSRDTVPEFLAKRGWLAGWTMSAPVIVSLVVMAASVGVLIMLVALWLQAGRRNTTSAETATNGQTQPRPIPLGTFPGKLETVTGKQFLNETVILDGRRFYDCKFVNCRLEYRATGNCDFAKCQFEGQYLLISPDEPCHVLFNILTLLNQQSPGGVTVYSRRNEETGEMEYRHIVAHEPVKAPFREKGEA